jgi:hypothetical protein
MVRRAARGIAAGIGVLAVVAGAVPASAQDLVVAPRLRSGDQFRLEVTRVGENSSRPQQDGRTTTSIDVRVVAASAERIDLEWIPGTAAAAGQIAQDPLLDGAARLLSGMVLRLTLNGDGAFTGVANQADVAPKLQAAVDSIIKGLADRLAPEQRKGFSDLVAQVLSPTVLLESATREAQMYFGLNGLTLSVGRTVELDVEQPNPLGGAVLPALVRIRAESATDDSALVLTTTTYDGAALLRLTRSLVEQTGARITDEDLKKLPTVDMDENGRYAFDRTLGLMREVVVNRRVVAGAERRTDRWEIRLSKAPDR